MYNICLGLIFSSVVNGIFFSNSLSLALLHGRCWPVSLYFANSSSDWWLHLIFAEMPLSCMPVFLIIFCTLKMLLFLCRTHSMTSYCIVISMPHIVFCSLPHWFAAFSSRRVCVSFSFLAIFYDDL